MVTDEIFVIELVQILPVLEEIMGEKNLRHDNRQDYFRTENLRLSGQRLLIEFRLENSFPSFLSLILRESFFKKNDLLSFFLVHQITERLIPWFPCHKIGLLQFPFSLMTPEIFRIEKPNC